MNCCYSDDDDDDGGSGGGCCRWRITGVKYNRSDKLSLPVLEHVRVCVWACAFWGLGLEKGSEKIFVWGPIFGRYHSNVHWLFNMHVFSLMHGVSCVFFCLFFFRLLLPTLYWTRVRTTQKRNCRLTLIKKDLLYIWKITPNKKTEQSRGRQRKRQIRWTENGTETERRRHTHRINSNVKYKNRQWQCFV